MAKKYKKKKEQKKKPIKKKKVIKKTKTEKKTSIWYLPILVLLILFLSFSSFLYILLSNSYREWEEDFLNNPNVLFFDYGNEQVNLDEKIQNYNETDAEYAFIEFDKRESVFLFSNSLDESLPDWIEIEKTALETQRGEWKFFAKSKIDNFSLPWFKILLKKEDVQSVDVYIEDIFLGDFSLKSFNFKNVVENANRGLNRGIQLVNDGNFAQRVFENIELGEESLVIRSRSLKH